MDRCGFLFLQLLIEEQQKKTSNDARCTFNSFILLDVNRNRIKFNFIVKRDHVIVSTSKIRLN